MFKKIESPKFQKLILQKLFFTYENINEKI